MTIFCFTRETLYKLLHPVFCVVVSAMLLYLAVSLLCPAVVGVGDPDETCIKDGMPGQDYYLEIFREIGKYGRNGVGAWILIRLCECKVFSYRYGSYYEVCRSHTHKTGCEGQNIRPNDDNQTFIQQLEPHVKNIGESINQVFCGRENHLEQLINFAVRGPEDKNWT